MSKNKKYDEVSVIRSLSKKYEVKVDSQRKVVEVVKNASSVGNGTWGKIDYLCNYCGYHTIMVNGISARKVNDVTRATEFAIKHQPKFSTDITESTKNAMKKVKFK